MILAHVKWFTTPEVPTSPLFSFSETSVVVWLGLALALLGLSFALNRKLKAWKVLDDWALKTKKHWQRALEVCFALSLLFAASQEALLAPHYASAHLLVSGFEAVAGLLLLFGREKKMALLFVSLLYLASSIQYGVQETSEYINLLGLAFFCAMDEVPYRTRILQVSTGLALVILAFTEKLLDPSQALDLLSRFQLNFMEVLGFNYSDRLFVLSAGTMEAVFGIVMIFNWIPRINIGSLACFLIGSNVFFFTMGYTQEGWIELFGHLPVYASALYIALFSNLDNVHRASLRS